MGALAARGSGDPTDIYTRTHVESNALVHLSAVIVSNAVWVISG